jgi:hypothetical protein
MNVAEFNLDPELIKLLRLSLSSLFEKYTVSIAVPSSNEVTKDSDRSKTRAILD